MAGGEEMGQALVPLIPRMFQGDTAKAISAFYHLLRYTDVSIKEQDQAVEVQVEEAPEILGPLAQATPIPFLCGGLQAILSAQFRRPLRFQSAHRDGNSLRLRFGP